MTEYHAYLDHNSSTFPLSGLPNVLERYLCQPLNPSSVHEYGRAARKALEEARANIAISLNIKLKKHEHKIIFTSGATESNNLIISNFKDDYVLYSPINHLSVIEPSKTINNAQKLKVDHRGFVDLEDLRSKLISCSHKRVLVSVMMANNETGIIEHLDQIGDLVHEYGGFLHSDCAQSYGKVDINLQDKKIDFISISSHKIGGLTGAGALIIPDDFDLEPLMIGGGQEKKYRAGTESMIPIISLGYAASMIDIMIETYRSKIQQIRDFVEEEISAYSKSAMIIGKNLARLPNTSLIAMQGVDANLQLIKFDQEKIYLSNGSACSSGTVKTSHVLHEMGYNQDITRSTIRVSFGLNNSRQDAEKFISIWKKIEGSNEYR